MSLLSKSKPPPLLLFLRHFSHQLCSQLKALFALVFLTTHQLCPRGQQHTDWSPPIKIQLLLIFFSVMTQDRRKMAVYSAALALTRHLFIFSNPRGAEAPPKTWGQVLLVASDRTAELQCSLSRIVGKKTGVAILLKKLHLMAENMQFWIILQIVKSSVAS